MNKVEVGLFEQLGLSTVSVEHHNRKGIGRSCRAVLPDRC